VRKTILGGIAVSATLGAIMAGGALAGPNAGKPVDTSTTVCGVGNAPMATADGQSNEDKFGGAMFTGNEQPAGTPCDESNSGPGQSTWTIGHGNVNTVTERGTEHGQYLLEGTTTQGGFNGHVTDWDFNGGDACVDAAGRSVFYQSGKETDCAPSFGPVGNFNTHGGAATGEHFRGNYGTIIFQKKSTTGTGPCEPGSSNYCIQVDLVGQTN
jgi:hypothetical protein